LLAGILLPILVFGTLYGAYELLELSGLLPTARFTPYFRERTCSIIGIAANAWLLNKSQQQYRRQAVRGIVLATTAWIIAWLAAFGKFVL
jgi:hypothetical protein